jgi:hypothetical protein
MGVRGVVTELGWKMHIVRSGEQSRGDKSRTVGSYQVYHDGKAVDGLSGGTAEPPGPSGNGPPDCGLCIAPGTYSLSTQDGDCYATIGFVVGTDRQRIRKPALALLGTGLRTDILIHPGHGYLASLGCLNLTNDALLEPEDIDFVDSLHRTIELIEDLRHFCGLKFPAGQRLSHSECFNRHRRVAGFSVGLQEHFIRLRPRHAIDTANIRSTRNVQFPPKAATSPVTAFDPAISPEPLIQAVAFRMID